MTTTRIDNCPICGGKHLIHRLSYTDHISGQTFEILSCSDCKLHITQQAPQLQHMSNFYANSDAMCYQPAKESYDKWIAHLHNDWNKEQVRIVQQEADRASGVLFEMGCKQGFFANTIRNSGWIAHAVEHDATAREYANKRFLLQIEDAGRLFDIHPRSYNVVVAWDTLGEAIDLNRTIDKLSQLIVADGTLIVAFHNATCADATHYGAAWSGWNAPRKRWHFSPQAFEMLVDKHNLEIINCQHSARRAFITALSSQQHMEGKRNIIKTLFKSLRQARASENQTYIIYTLKHKQQ